MSRFDHPSPTILRVSFETSSRALRKNVSFSEEDQKKTGRTPKENWVINKIPFTHFEAFLPLLPLTIHPQKESLREKKLINLREEIFKSQKLKDYY